jgi:putative phosphoesterase
VRCPIDIAAVAASAPDQIRARFLTERDPYGAPNGTDARHGRRTDVNLEEGLRRAANVKLAVLADTHSPRFWKQCPGRVAERLGDVDAILHAGDVCTADVLDELGAYAPVLAVLGNNDGPDVAAWGAPDRRVLEIAGLRVGMIHDSGPAQGRAARMRRAFPDCGLVVFGHSHVPWETESDGQRLFNPGSPTDRRRQPQGTMGIIEISHGTPRTQLIGVTDPR